jgi:hypothetical protein
LLAFSSSFQLSHLASLASGVLRCYDSSQLASLAFGSFRLASFRLASLLSQSSCFARNWPAACFARTRFYCIIFASVRSQSVRASLLEVGSLRSKENFASIQEIRPALLAIGSQLTSIARQLQLASFALDSHYCTRNKLALLAFSSFQLTSLRLQAAHFARTRFTSLSSQSTHFIRNPLAFISFRMFRIASLEISSRRLTSLSHDSLHFAQLTSRAIQLLRSRFARFGSSRFHTARFGCERLALLTLE